jgi:hypothetical protein
MTPASDSTLNRIAAAGLLAGAGFGLGGTLVRSPDLQASLWAIDSVALVVATSLLTLKYFRAGSEIVSAGFLVFAIGEGAALRHCGRARGQCTRLCSGDGSVGRRPADDKCGTATLELAAPAGRCSRLLVCDHGRPDLCWRSAAAHLVTTAVFRLSFFRGDLAGMGLEAAARGGGTARWLVAARRSAATGDRCRMSGVQVSRWLRALKPGGAP